MSTDAQNRPKVGVAVLIKRADNTILMTKRHGAHGQGTWSVPGGHLEYGETWEECGKREAMEEVGAEMTNVSLLAVTNDLFEKEGKHYVTIWLTADWIGNEPRIRESDKIHGLEWCSLDDLPEPLFEPCWTNLRRAKPDLFA